MEGIGKERGRRTAAGMNKQHNPMGLSSSLDVEGGEGEVAIPFHDRSWSKAKTRGMLKLSPKITIFVVLVGLLLVVLYHRAVTTTISSITSSFVDQTDFLARVPASFRDDDGASKALARHKFEDVWKVIRSELLVHFEEKQMPVDAHEWYKRVSHLLPFFKLLSLRIRGWIEFRL
jgi:hypothetical protein